jgi:hypothetical protein
MGAKYQGGHGERGDGPPPRQSFTATGGTRRWVVFTPEHIVTWDNHKLRR